MNYEECYIKLIEELKCVFFRDSIVGVWVDDRYYSIGEFQLALPELYAKLLPFL